MEKPGSNHSAKPIVTPVHSAPGKPAETPHIPAGGHADKLDAEANAKQAQKK